MTIALHESPLSASASLVSTRLNRRAECSVGRFVAAAMALVVLTGGCWSDGGSEPTAQDWSPGNTIDYSAMERDREAKQRAWVACYQDNGIDSELMPDGGVHSDRNGTLSREELRELSELCQQRLEDEGFVLRQERSDEFSYKAWVDFHACMADQGIALGELVSFESYSANPSSVNELLMTQIRKDLWAFKEAYDNCPSRIAVIGLGIVGE